MDILESHKGPLVIEINLSPGLQGITKATKANVAEKIAKYLYKETKKRVEKGKSKETDDILKEIDAGGKKDKNHIIANLDFRGNRILLPEIITNITRFDKDEEYEMDMSDGELRITPFMTKKGRKEGE